ncbi:MAG TPA: DUF2309 domain-containing protein [Nitrospiraceae bacterium]|nr:DUF2309 domain-containing protein [Nitrospiraceae bacterium]
MNATITPAHRFTDAQRMELRSYVELAGEVIAQYWPMRTFIHHNPLHGLESLPFYQAVARGAELFGGRGYLSNEMFREYLHRGRIDLDEVRAALQPLATPKELHLGSLTVTHLDVLCASMIHGVMEEPPAARACDVDSRAMEQLLSWVERSGLTSRLMEHPGHQQGRSESTAIAETLSGWCDKTFGTTIVETIDREMVKWCSVFLDEGHATWAMPHRERTFYRSWKSLAHYDMALRLMGITDAAKKLRLLPDGPEDAMLEALAALEIPKSAWEEYLSWHLATLPGWTGYLKWRAAQTAYPWQQAFPIDLVKYLAVRLFYERELVERACRRHLGTAGTYLAIQTYRDRYPHVYRFQRDVLAGYVDKAAATAARRLFRSRQQDPARWEELARRHEASRREHDVRRMKQTAARSLLSLTQAFSVDVAAVEGTSPSDVGMLLQWLFAFPPSKHGPYWQTAFETTYWRSTLDQLVARARQVWTDPEDANRLSSRPLAQVVFCIDVRSEVFRRHLERQGGYQTLGLAGFFGVPLDYQPFNGDIAVSHCPVLLKPKNRIREIPRSYHSAVAERYKSAAQLGKAAHGLLHDLKENLITPYVMVEALGWLFGLPFFGKTLLPRWYHKAAAWVRRALMPPLATTLTVEKITREEAEAMIAAEQLATIREIVRERFGLTGGALSPTQLDKVRRKALGQADGMNGEIGKTFHLTPEAEDAFYQDLREQHHISPRGISARFDRLTQTGFTVNEQAYFVEAALRLIGLTTTFARLLVFCAHGSTSDNNPYESALDCGACGGNQGLPNARTIAAMANKPAVRDLLRKRGITIPSDTHFLAAQHDTTTDHVSIVDLEDVPATHRKDLQRLLADLDAAGTQAARERSADFGMPTPSITPATARQFMQRRSEDWSEVRPEWGLSRNSMMVIGRRELTEALCLDGRSFLHSYDYRQDGSGKLLETIMTAPLIVAQWINMEHYFSTTDNEVYGSGSKVYHNVVGRFGVMAGSSSDLRIGLPAQTVLNGPQPYHEPMRLLAVIEAPCERIRAIVNRHRLLEQLFNGAWVALVALDPNDGEAYDYEAGAWRRRGRP